jgi:hypothetical protein
MEMQFALAMYVNLCKKQLEGFLLTEDEAILMSKLCNLMEEATRNAELILKIYNAAIESGNYRIDENGQIEPLPQEGQGHG